jgi:hypothetical protein
VSPSVLTFTSGNYSTPQSVTLTGVHDADMLFEEVVINATIPGSSTIPWTVYTNDDETNITPVADTGIYGICYNDTGPTTCGTEFIGQDGDFMLPMIRDITNATDAGGAWVTTDILTGLTWKSCSDGASNEYNGTNCAGTNNPYNWDTALLVCSSLNGMTYAGRTDWRLPDWYELGTIVDYLYFLPAVPPAQFPDTAYSNYWSSSVSVDNPATMAWALEFSDGTMSIASKTSNSYYVRCVAGP